MIVTGDGAHIRFVLLAASGGSRADPTPTASNSDQIDACRRGDRSAIEQVFRTHFAAVERLLTRIVGPRADVEDLLQDTFCAALAAFPRFRGEASVLTWLHRIAINVAHNYLRQPRHRRDTPLDADHDVPMAALDPAIRELAHKMYAHLDTLDPRKRIAFLLHAVEDLPIAEVAALMGASRAATKSRIFWARRALLKRLERDTALRGGKP